MFFPSDHVKYQEQEYILCQTTEDGAAIIIPLEPGAETLTVPLSDLKLLSSPLDDFRRLPSDTALAELLAAGEERYRTFNAATAKKPRATRATKKVSTASEDF